MSCLALCSAWPAGPHLDRLVPLLEEFCGLEDDELRESCLQAYEAFLRK